MQISVVICIEQMTLFQKVIEHIKVMAGNQDVDINIYPYYREENLKIDIKDGRICPDIILVGTGKVTFEGTKLAKDIRRLGYIGKLLFVTESEEYYQDAFDVHAFHYILEGKVTDEKFEDIFRQMIERVIEEEREYIILSRQGTYKKIPLDEIRYFEVFRRVIVVHYEDNEEFEFYSRLGVLENRLLGHSFVRIHRSYLVNMKYIDSAETDKVVMTNREELPVGKTYHGQLKEIFNTFKNPIKFKEMEEPLSKIAEG